MGGDDLKLSFKRIFNSNMHGAVDQWYQLHQIVSSVCSSDNEDAMVSKLQSSGLYTSQSLYAVINFSGIIPVFIDALCNLYVPPRVHIILWLLSHSKLLTRDNLIKKQSIHDETRLLCSKK
jgi:hypothetical protein